MTSILTQLNIQLDESLYLKDPMGTEVGHELVRTGAELIAHDGLESFTMKKLATELGSPESTVYRYFQNKNQLMLYISSWYWSLLEWKIAFATANLSDARQSLDKALQVLSGGTEEVQTAIVHEQLLNKIVIRESFKSLHICAPNTESCERFFGAYLNLTQRLAELISNVHRAYPMPKALAVTLIETAHYQQFLQHFIPALTEVRVDNHHLQKLLHHIAFKALDEL
jgi:AcrR family transcriptional regulator